MAETAETFAPLARSAFGVLGYAFLADFTTDTHSPIPKSAPKSPKVWGYASLAAPKILIEVWGYVISLAVHLTHSYPEPRTITPFRSWSRGPPKTAKDPEGPVRAPSVLWST